MLGSGVRGGVVSYKVDDPNDLIRVVGEPRWRCTIPQLSFEDVSAQLNT
jgi:hypothetical protein